MKVYDTSLLYSDFTSYTNNRLPKCSLIQTLNNDKNNIGLLLLSLFRVSLSSIHQRQLSYITFLWILVVHSIYFHIRMLLIFGNICIFRKLQILQIYSVNRSLPISNITNLFLPFFLILYIFLLCIFRILQVLQIYFSQIFGKYLHIANMTNF